MAERLDYTQRDESTALLRVQRLAKSVYPNWDFSKKDIGNAILRCVAWLIGVLSWLTDFWAREALPTKATLRRSVQAHSRWLGYTMRERTAAVVPVTFTLPSPHSQDINIPQGAQFSIPTAGAPMLFQLQGAVSLPASSTSATGILEHAESAQDTEISNGRPWQQYRLAQAPFLLDSLSVSASNGSYDVVENLLQSEEADRHCYVEIDDDGKGVVLFGDGVTGEIPDGTITFSYKVGGGEEGNVEPTTWDAVNPLLDLLGNPVNVAITSSVAATGGSNGETLGQAKSNATASLVTRNRTVTREDFENVAITVPSVARALAMTSKEWGLIREGEVVTWIVAKGTRLPSGRHAPAVPDASALAAVAAAWESLPYPFNLRPRAVGDLGWQIWDIDVSATVVLRDDAPAEIGQILYDTLRDWFAVDLEDGSPNPNIDFGFRCDHLLAWSDIFNALRDTDGVRKMSNNALTLNGQATDVTLPSYVFPRLGVVSLRDQDGNILPYVGT
jgi:hypothetical protein